MSRYFDESMTMFEMLAVVEPVAASEQVEREERSRALLMMFPLPTAVTTLPPCPRDTLLWVM